MEILKRVGEKGWHADIIVELAGILQEMVEEAA